VVASVDRALRALDDGTVALARPALESMRRAGAGPDPDVVQVRSFLRRELPTALRGRDRHETAWALGDVFEVAGLIEQSRLCRAATTHEILAVWRWTESFSDVPKDFWRPALAGLEPPAATPARVGLSLASAQALLEVVGASGLGLEETGELPAATVLGLDDRFRWTEQFPWMHRTGEQDIPPVRILHEHLTAQRLLVHHSGRLSRTRHGLAALNDLSALWRAVVEPAPRWSHEFDRDTLGLMAASLLGSGVFKPERLTEAITGPLAAKWRSAEDRVVFDGASLVVHAWYRLGVPLGWWNTGRGPADRHPNTFGRAAAAAVFRSMGRSAGRAADRPTEPDGRRPA
jgi:hypothetical protein